MLYYDPLRRMQRLMDVMDRLMEQSVIPARALEEVSRGKVSLPVNVRADGDTFIITAWVPGVSVDDLHIQILDNTISIEGEFQAPEEDDYLVQEIPVGAFQRVITLPTALEPGEAEAELRDGVLTLRVPKAQAVRPKEIKVKAK